MRAFCFSIFSILLCSSLEDLKGWMRAGLQRGVFERLVLVEVGKFLKGLDLCEPALFLTVQHVVNLPPNQSQALIPW